MADRSDDARNDDPSHDPNDGRRDDLNDEKRVAEDLERERHALLHTLDDRLETPMVVLAFVWLMLLVVELIWGEIRVFSTIGTVIWLVFIVDFGVKLVLAPRRSAYLRKNWLGAISLAIPALRIFRITRVIRLFRVTRVGRGLRLVRVVGSLNRGMRALGATLNRRGFGYVIALTALVTFAGAAGMFAFENHVPGGLDSYGEALWWTTMIMTTFGSQYWPETFEGRMLSILLALYAVGVFGYVTATLATFFIGRDADSADTEVAGKRELVALRTEVADLRSELGAVAEDLRTLARGPPGP